MVVVGPWFGELRLGVGVGFSCCECEVGIGYIYMLWEGGARGLVRGKRTGGEVY